MLVMHTILISARSWAQAVIQACSLIYHNLHAKSLYVIFKRQYFS